MRRGFAIVGMACRYPDADNPRQLWENVLAQRRAFRRLPAERLNPDDYLSKDHDAADKTYCVTAAVLKDWEFDRHRFRVAGQTFRSADMAHWLALETAADALADAGFPDGNQLPKDSTGVLLGNSLTGEFSRANLMRLRWPYVARVLDSTLQNRDWSSEQRGQLLGELEQSYKSAFPPVGDETLAGGLSNTIAGRICNHFDLHGGGYTVDGACASSLLSVANACSSLAVGDTDVMLSGGVDLSLDPFELIGFAKVGALAAENMRVFDRHSAGFWPGEGCGFVVLMREEDAIAQRRKIYAVIRGWGVSSDGSGGITRPETEGQQLCLQRAYRRAGYGADSVGYFEGHGTGTTLGDATELRTISRARREDAKSDPRPAVVGSIKANIGHTKAASGVAGLIKAAMSVDRQLIPPTTGWETANPVIAEEGNVLRLLHECQPWNQDDPIRVGVSGMGFGGINAHLTLEGVTKHRRVRIRREDQRLASSMQDAEVFLLAADSRSQLKDQVEHLLGFAARVSHAELGDLASELSRRLSFGRYRAAMTAATPDELDAATSLLAQWLGDDDDSRTFRWDRSLGVVLGTTTEPPKIGFLFPGQGYLPSVDGGLWRRRFELVEDLYENLSLPRDVDLVQTRYAQPTIVAAELAGIRLLDELGVEASVAIGHSLGELTAYHWAGAYDAMTLLRLAAERGNVMSDHSRGGGAMASIAADITTVNSLVADTDVAIAAVNSPSQTVVSGTVEAVNRVAEQANERNIGAALLSVSHAFHSPLMADAVPAFRSSLADFDYAELKRKVLSTISGERLVPGADLRSLLVQQLTSPVRFVDAIRQADDVELWIEVGPGRVLSGLAGKTIDTPTVSVDSSGETLHGLLNTVAVAFTMGVNVRQQALFEDRFARPFDLDFSPKFLANPCEQAPTSNTVIPTIEPTTLDHTPAEQSTAEPNAAAPLECIRNLAAQRAELPVESVRSGDRLLNELHLSSIVVGQLVADATKQLGLSPPTQPTDAANATIQDIADYLQQRLDQENEGSPIESEEDQAPAGVGSWTREFVVRFEARDIDTDRSDNDPGEWTILSSGDDPLKVPLEQSFSRSASGSGTILCLSGVLGPQQIDLLLDGARQAIEKGSGYRFMVVQRGFDLQTNTGAAPFVRSFQLEYPDVITRVVTIPQRWADAKQAAEWVAQEATGSRPHREAYYDDSGTRREPVWSVTRAQPSAFDIPLDPDDVLLVTGGGKGISAESALALARETGVRLALLGRSRPDQDETLRANLDRMRHEGVTLLYLPADVTDSESVGRAIEKVQKELGAVTAIIHGAGTNLPQGIATLTTAAFTNTLAPKVDGLQNVLRAIDPEQLRLLVTFGSIIAPVGLRGQADYAVANELLAQTTQSWAIKHPHCHAICLQWSVWAGVGMGETLGAVESLRREGIRAISVDEGIRQLKHAVSQSQDSARIVIAGRFGHPSTIQFADDELPLLRFLEHPRVHTPGVELVVDSTLSMQTDPYLGDHVYQGVSLLPAVVGLEAMAQAATGVMNWDHDLSHAWLEFENIELLHPVIVQDQKNTEMRVAAQVRADGDVDLVLRSGATGFHQDHFRACMRIATQPPAMAPTLSSRGFNDPLPMDASDLYGSLFFHQGRFQRVQQYLRLDATHCVAKIDSFNGDNWYGTYLPRQMILGDPASRDAIVHCIQACIPHGTLLPIAVERVSMRARDDQELRVQATERERDDDEFVYDVDVTQMDGTLVEQWRGLRLRKVSDIQPQPNWPWPLLVPYFERRLADKFKDSRVSLRMNTNGRVGEHTSDDVIAAAAGVDSIPPRRGDGKPELDGRSVSATKCGGMTMAVAAESQVACDAEVVCDKRQDQWNDLLGDQRVELAQLISRTADEGFQTAATRVWCANECLTKAGLPAREALTLDQSSSDGWVTLRSGDRRIATWLWQASGERAAQVFAVLVSPSERVIACDLLNTNT